MELCSARSVRSPRRRSRRRPPASTGSGAYPGREPARAGRDRRARARRAAGARRRRRRADRACARHARPSARRVRRRAWSFSCIPSPRRRLRRAAATRAGEVLPRLASGESIGTLAFSERGTGAHFYSPGAEGDARERRPSRISGRKSFVTSGGHADVYLVLVQGEAEGTADAYLVARRRSRRALRTEPGPGSAWPATRASRSSSTVCSVDDGDRIGSAGGGDRARLRARSRRSSSSASRRSTSASPRRRRRPRPRMLATAATPTARRSPRSR